MPGGDVKIHCIELKLSSHQQSLCNMESTIRTICFWCFFETQWLNRFQIKIGFIKI